MAAGGDDAADLGVFKSEGGGYRSGYVGCGWGVCGEGGGWASLWVEEGGRDMTERDGPTTGLGIWWGYGGLGYVGLEIFSSWSRLVFI
jgi:hypothetical protein